MLNQLNESRIKMTDHIKTVQSSSTETPAEVAVTSNEPGHSKSPVTPGTSMDLPPENTHPRSGYSDSAHGNEYHLQLLMLLMLRARKSGRKFKIASDYSPAGKFDDIYFSYESENGEWVNIFMQLKHSDNESGASYSLQDFIKLKSRINFKLFTESHKDIKNIEGSNICMLYTNKSMDIVSENNETVKKIYEHFTNDMIKQVKLDFPNIFKNNVLKLSDDAIEKIHTKHFSTTLSKDDFTNFSSEFIFAVNQYNVSDLETMVTEELSLISQCVDYIRDNMQARLKDWVHKWMMVKSTGSFIDNKKLQEFMNKITLNIRGQYNNLPRGAITSFFGREIEQNKAADVFSSSKLKETIDVSITGPPGVGKTELTLKIAEKNSKKFDHIIWMLAETKNSLENEFLRLAKELNISSSESANKELNIKYCIEMVYKTMSVKKCLFIFDNAVNSFNLNDFLPPPSVNKSNLYFMLTSQYKKWNCNNNFELDVFSLKESEEFVLVNIPAISETDAKELSLILGNLPLALQIAISYIQVQCEELDFEGETFSISDFIKSFSDSPEDILEHSLSDSITMSYNKPLVKIWNKAINTVKSKKNGELAINILNTIAFMEPDNIPISIIKLLIKNDAIVRETLVLLKQFSLIKNNGPKLYVHRLLQEITRINCKELTEPLCDNIFEVFIQEFINNENNPDKSTYDFVPHAMKFWDHISKTESLARKFTTLPLKIVNAKILPWKSYVSDSQILTFIEKHSNLVRDIVGWETMAFLLMQYKYITLLCKNESYGNALNICNEIFNNINESNIYKLFILTLSMTRLKCLETLSQIYEAWNEKLHVFKIQKNTLGLSFFNTKLTFMELFEDIFKIEDENKKIECKNIWLEFLNEFSIGTDIEFNFILNCIEEFSYNSKEIQWELYNLVQQASIELYGLSHTRTLLILIRKASINFKVEKDINFAYKIINNVMQIMKVVNNFDSKLILALFDIDDEIKFKSDVSLIHDYSKIKSDVLIFCKNLLKQKVKDPFGDHNNTYRLLKCLRSKYRYRMYHSFRIYKLYKNFLDTLQSSENNSELINQVLFDKASFYCAKFKLKKGWLIFYNLYKKYKTQNTDTQEILTSMCLCAYELSEKGHTEQMDICYEIINERLVDLNIDFEETMKIARCLVTFDIVCFIHWRREQLLEVYERLLSSIIPQLGEEHERTTELYFGKIMLLHLLNRHNEAWSVVEKLYNNNIKSPLLYKIIENMFLVAFSQNNSILNKTEIKDTFKQISRSEKLHFCFDSLENALKLELNKPGLLNIAKTVKHFLFKTASVRNDILIFYDKIIKILISVFGNEHRMTLIISLNKALFLIDNENSEISTQEIEEAWTLYVGVCDVQRVKPKIKTTDIQQLLYIFNNMDRRLSDDDVTSYMDKQIEPYTGKTNVHLENSYKSITY